MGRTKGSKNKPKRPPKEVLLSIEQKTIILADLLLEVVIDEQRGANNET